MKITFELTPLELESAVKDGTLEALLKHASVVEKAGKAIAADKAREQAAATTESPTVSAPAAPAPTFNPTVTTPVNQAPAGFDPMAVGTPAPTAPQQPAAAQTPPTAPVTPPAGGQPTIDEVRAKIAPLIKAGKVAEMQALFAEFGAQKLTDVDPANYAALITKAATI